MTGLFFLSAFLSLAVMFWPYLIPYSITVANAAAPDASLRFLFYGAVVALPAIAIYTIGVYWVFRGKIHDDRFDEQPTASEASIAKAPQSVKGSLKWIRGSNRIDRGKLTR